MTWYAYTRTPQGTLERVPVEPPLEAELELHVNGETLVRLACSPRDLKALAVGFLYTAGFIQSLEDLEELYLNRSQSCADIWLRTWVEGGARTRLRPSGCAGGLGLALDFEPDAPLTADYTLSLELLAEMMRALLQGDAHQGTRALHISGLFTPQGELLVAMQDLGRHNTLDKIAGHCLLEGIPIAGKVLLTSGRISSEMVTKAARLGLPVVGSLKAVTSRALELAEAWGITALGYVSRRDVCIYTHPERIAATGL